MIFCFIQKVNTILSVRETQGKYNINIPSLYMNTFLFSVENAHRSVYVIFWNVFVLKMRKVEYNAEGIFSTGFHEFSKCDNVSLYTK